MNKLQTNLAAKIVAFLLMVIFAVTFVLSAVVVLINIKSDWYSNNKDVVQQKMYDDMADTANSRLISYIYDSAEENGDFSIDSNIWSNSEFIYGESMSNSFGYAIYKVNSDTGKYDYDNPLRVVNQDIFSDGYVNRYMHDDYEIDVYISNPDDGTLPYELNALYKYDKLVYEYRNVAIVTCAVFFIAALAMLVFLVCAAGKRKITEDQKDTDSKGFKAIPLDLLGAVVLVIIAGIWAAVLGSEYSSLDVALASITVLSGIVSTLVGLYIVIFAARVKLGNWWESTVIYYICRQFVRACKITIENFHMVRVIWKTVIVLAIVGIIGLVICINLSIDVWRTQFWMGVAFLFYVLIVILVMRTSVGIKKLHEGCKHMAQGDMDYKIDDRWLYLDFKDIAKDLNSIGEGMEAAIETKVQSERLRNELITNVSHDIKTPLTSIINYVDLLKKIDIDSDEAQEYIEVIDRQSQRLKKLTEDVIDASKIATGNIKLDMAPCQVLVLMSQVDGEYAKSLEENDLELVKNITEEPVEIMGDGRSLWRVFSNVLSNICKYSQPGTRVYETLDVVDGKAVITYKNTSNYQLNISEDELMERFVRGDSSRHTEGSGLGLSIARNLVELQGGTFEIDIDGDLFKVVMRWETYPPEERRDGGDLFPRGTRG